MAFETDDLLALADRILTYKNNQDSLQVQERISANNNSTKLLIQERQADLNEQVQFEKNSLSLNQTVLKDQKTEIDFLKKKLNGWDISYEDHLSLPDNFKSPDGDSVIDEHTNQFKGKLFETFEAGNDTLDLIQNSSDAINYNSQVLEALNGLEQEYTRGQGFADNVKTDLLIKGIKDGVDLSQSVLDYQAMFTADKAMLEPGMDEEKWNTRYANLRDTNVQFDSDMTEEKFNSKWQDWQFITDQTVAYDESGLPFIVTSGPGASDFVSSPEWKGLMDQLAEETNLTPGGGKDWDTNVSQYLMSKIEDNTTKRNQEVTASKTIKELQKSIGNRDEYIMQGSSEYIKTMLKNIDNQIGTNADPAISETLFKKVQGVTKNWNTIGPNFYNEGSIPALKSNLEEVILSSLEFATGREQYKDTDLTPDLIEQLIENKDMPNLISVALYGTTIDELDGQFGGKDSPFNFYRSTLSAKDREVLNKKGGLFNPFDAGQIVNPNNNEGNRVNPGAWLLGKDEIMYDGMMYKQSDVSGEAFDFNLGPSSNKDEYRVIRKVMETWEVLYDLEQSKALGGSYGAAGLHSSYTPNIPMTNLTGNENRSIAQQNPVSGSLGNMTPYRGPAYLQPRLQELNRQEQQLRLLMESQNYNPQDLTNIESTLAQLEQAKSYYE